MNYYLIGSSTSGKTHLANTLCKKLDNQRIDLDDIFWEDKYTTPRSKESRTQLVQDILGKETPWLVEGAFYGKWINPFLEVSDLIFYIETPPFFVILYRALQRKKQRSKNGEENGKESFCSILKMTKWAYRSRKQYPLILKSYQEKIVSVSYRSRLFK